MSIMDKTRMKIGHRLRMCFWLPMVREWTGGSLIAYYSERVSLVSMLSGVLPVLAGLGCVPLYFTIEYAGQRSVLLCDAMIKTLAITVFATLVAISCTTAIRWAAISIMFVFFFVFG